MTATRGEQERETAPTMRVAATAAALAVDVAHVWSAQQTSRAAAHSEGATSRGRGLSRLGPAGGGPLPGGSEDEHVQAAREAHFRFLRAVGRTAAAWLRAGESSGLDSSMSDMDATPMDGVEVGAPSSGQPMEANRPADVITRQLLSTVLLLASECVHMSDSLFLLQPVWQALLPPLCRIVSRAETPPETTLVALQLLSSAAGPSGLPLQECMAVFEPYLRAVATLWRLMRSATTTEGEAGAWMCVCGGRRR